MKKLKKAVIIGYGSIGKKHADILSKLKLFNEIYIKFFLYKWSMILNYFLAIKYMNITIMFFEEK